MSYVDQALYHLKRLELFKNLKCLEKFEYLKHLGTLAILILGLCI